MKVPSMKSLSNEVCFETNYVNQRLSMPWTGLTIFEKNEELKLLAVNAVSDLFEAVIHNEAVNDENEIFDTTFDTDLIFGLTFILRKQDLVRLSVKISQDYLWQIL